MSLHCPPLRATLVARSFFSVWMPRSTTAMALRSSGRFVWCTASGNSRSSVTNSLPRSVVTTKFPSSARLVARPTVSAFLFCRGSTAASRVKTSITTRPYFVFPRVFWLKSMRSACSRSFGPSAADLPSARGRGACTCRPTSAFSASKAMACVTCLASRYSFRGSLTLKSSARSLSASIYNPKRGYSRFRGCEEA